MWRLRIRVEVSLQDLWIGAYWRTHRVYWRTAGGDEPGWYALPWPCDPSQAGTCLHLYICLVPCVPIHVTTIWPRHCLENINAD
jgi:hypothetical protein